MLPRRRRQNAYEGAPYAGSRLYSAAAVGAYFMEKLKTLPHVKEVRGQGLLVGVEFDDKINAVDVKHECLHRHLLITAIGAHIIRMVPPLIITKEDCDKAYELIKASVEALAMED